MEKEKCPKCKETSLIINAGQYAIGIKCTECDYSHIQGVL